MKNLPVIARGIAPALSALSLAMVAGAKAQSLEINPVVISAARVEQPLSQALTSVSVITRQDIDKSQAPSLAELLRGGL
jgi:vitamin B12 transporter